MIKVSGKLTPAAFTAMRTWPLPSGLEGSSISLRLSGPPGASLIIARIACSRVAVFRSVAALIRWPVGLRPSVLEKAVRGEEDGRPVFRGIDGGSRVRPRLDAHCDRDGQRVVQ